jgi:hypothetical protein
MTKLRLRVTHVTCARSHRLAAGIQMLNLAPSHCLILLEEPEDVKTVFKKGYI